MMSLAGASRAVVPVSFCGWAGALPAAVRPAALATGAGAAVGPDPASADIPELTALPELAELAELFELPAEHPARNMPPPSTTLPSMKPTMAPRPVRPVRVPRRAKPCVFSMPL